MPLMKTLLQGREARPAPTAWNIAKTLVQALTIWALFLFLIPAKLVQQEHALGLTRAEFASPLSRTVGGVLFVVIGAFGLSCGILMAVRGGGTPLPLDCTQRLVIAGPYRYVRNPMAIASFTQGGTVGIYLGSPLVLAYALAGAVFWHLVLRRWEEADLERRFGAPFRRYRAQVRCWLPRRTPYEP